MQHVSETPDQVSENRKLPIPKNTKLFLTDTTVRIRNNPFHKLLFNTLIQLVNMFQMWYGNIPTSYFCLDITEFTTGTGVAICNLEFEDFYID